MAFSTKIRKRLNSETHHPSGFGWNCGPRMLLGTVPWEKENVEQVEGDLEGGRWGGELVQN